MDDIDWIKQIEQLQEEKINLKCQNDKFKEEDYKLKNVIHRLTTIKYNLETDINGLRNKVNELQKRCEKAEEMLWNFHLKKEGAEKAIEEHFKKFFEKEW